MKATSPKALLGTTLSLLVVRGVAASPVVTITDRAALDVSTVELETKTAVARRATTNGGFMQYCYLAMVVGGSVYGLLEASCVINGKETSTELDLNQCLANYDGHIAWAPQGNAFRSCKECVTRRNHVNWLDCGECGSIDLNLGVHVTTNGTLGCFDVIGASTLAPTVGGFKDK